MDYSKVSWATYGYLAKGDGHGKPSEDKEIYKDNWDRDIEDFPNYTSFGGKTNIYIQYAKSHTNPIEAYCRFEITCPNESGNSWNYYYALLNPTDADKRRLIKIKGKWTAGQEPDFPYHSTDYTNTSTRGIFKLTKDYSDKAFVMPPVWIINDGANNVMGKEEYQEKVKQGKTTWADLFYKAYSRGGFRYTLKNSLIRIYPEYKLLPETSYQATEIKKGNITIRDNGDNTYLVEASAGSAGTNNEIKKATLTCRTDVSQKIVDCTKKSISFTDEIPSNYGRSLDQFFVKAELVTEGTYGLPKYTDLGAYIKHYVSPLAPYNPVLEYHKSKLTIRENWRYHWDEAISANSCSPVIGYQIQLLKNSKPVTGLMVERGPYNNGNKVVSIPGNLNTSFEHLAPDIYFDPAELGYKAKDTVGIKVRAYTVNGVGTKLYSDYAASENLEIQNAGLVHVKVNKRWTEGQVYIKVAGHWREAETVMTKVNGHWQESI